MKAASPVSLVLAALREAGVPLSVAEMAERTGVRAYQLYGYLPSMASHGLVVKSGTRPAQYALPQPQAAWSRFVAEGTR